MMNYTFYAISSYNGNMEIIFKCRNMSEYDCLTLSRFLPNKSANKEMIYYILSNDYNRLFELSSGRIVSILKFEG